MSKFLTRFKRIIDLFINKKISANKFVKRYSKLFYDESIQPINKKEFDIIDELWGWLDGYEPSPRIRRDLSDLIDGEQLRKIVKKYKFKIDKENKKSRGKG